MVENIKHVDPEATLNTTSSTTAKTGIKSNNWNLTFAIQSLILIVLIGILINICILTAMAVKAVHSLQADGTTGSGYALRVNIVQFIPEYLRGNVGDSVSAVSLGTAKNPFVFTQPK
jgi:hypothetical protein